MISTRFYGVELTVKPWQMVRWSDGSDVDPVRPEKTLLLSFSLQDASIPAMRHVKRVLVMTFGGLFGGSFVCAFVLKLN